MNFKNPNERAGAIGTIVFHALLLLLVVLLGYCTDLSADELDAGGVTVSLGQPDQGGEDNSTAEQEEEYTPQEEEYTPENQVTSDVEEAPEVKKTTPNPKPKTTPTETKSKETPKETKPERKPNAKDLFGKKDKGTGSGGGTTGGDKGEEDGEEGGNPDGQGSGSGAGTKYGDGFNYSGFGGLKVLFSAKPRSGSQETGSVVIYACINGDGKVISVGKSKKRVNNQTFDQDLYERAKEAMYKFRFQKSSDSNKKCGDVVFNFKLH